VPLAPNGRVRLVSPTMSEQEPTPASRIPKDWHSALLLIMENWAVIKSNFLLFVVLVALAVMAGAIVVRQLDTRQIDILTADNAHLRDRNTSLAQTVTVTPPSQWRRLSDRERSELIQALREWPLRPKTLSIFAMAETEARQYAGQFLDVLRSAGIEPKALEVAVQGWGGPVQPGLMVGVINFDNPPPEARAMLQILKEAGLDAQFTVWGGNPNENPAYDLFVGPKPW
jgi:hypothetical protein